MSGAGEVANMAQAAAGALLGAFTLYSLTRSKKSHEGSAGKSDVKGVSPSYESLKNAYINVEKKDSFGDDFASHSSVTSTSSSSGMSSDNNAVSSGISKRKLRMKSLTARNLRMRDGKQKILVNALEDVSNVAEGFSDLVFDFTSTYHASHQSKPSTKIVPVESRPGSGSIVVGAICDNEAVKVSAITSADALKFNLPTLFQVSSLKLPSVWHIACRGVDVETLKLYTDYSQLAPLLNSNFAVFTPTTPQEVHGFAVLGHYLSHACRIPVANCFDGFLAHTQKNTISLKSNLELGVRLGEYSSGGPNDLLEAAAQLSQNVLRKPFRPFEYYGPKSATAVVVVFGSASQAFVDAVRNNTSPFASEVGVLVVKLLRPFSDSKFIAALPTNVQRICVVDFSPNLSNALFRDIAASLHSSEGTKARENFFPSLISTKINSKDVVQVDDEVASFVLANVLAAQPDTKQVVDAASLEKLRSRLMFYSYGFGAGQTNEVEKDYFEFVFWQAIEDEKEDDNTWYKGLHERFENVQVTVKVDKVAQTKRVELRLANSSAKLPTHGITTADVVVCNNVSEAVARSVKTTGTVVVLSKNDDVRAEVKNLISDRARDVLSRNANTIYGLTVEESDSFEEAALQAALCLETEDGIQSLRAQMEEINPFSLRSTFGLSSIEEKQAESVDDFVARYQPFIEPTAAEKFYQTMDDVGSVPKYKFAWNLMFPGAFSAARSLRPSEHDVSTAIVTKFERLTPLDYNRNIFHIEFDISNTDIKYEIGDALGVFGENDPVKVNEFISQYGLDPSEIVKLPARGKMSDDTCEYISVHNLLLKNLDLFGKVQKKFYVELAKFAKSRYEYLKLMHTGTDDAEQFKLGTYETVTYAELLLQYKSCKLSITDMIKLIPEIKARHYSISSSMKMNPRSVHLLVVAVDWVTPLGKVGQGQCTRYLKDLQIGQKVTVDIQKSVLRLPPDHKQPIVMAGLGTGMAPFRAFIQQRYWLKRSGHEIGPMVLYFGARHKNQEWLYGEELEKYEKMGLLRLGLAWSRDQKHKVYIQHKIKGDSALLKEYLKDKKGYFYLCGPTWPVPDVRNAIASGLDPEKNGGKEESELDVTVVEDMKEEGRYILEVY